MDTIQVLQNGQETKPEEFTLPPAHNAARTHLLCRTLTEPKWAFHEAGYYQNLEEEGTMMGAILSLHEYLLHLRLCYRAILLSPSKCYYT
jgi:hypothetical protein